MQLALEDSLLIAMRAESLRSVFLVKGRPDTVALDALLAQIRHVCRASTQGWQHGRVVEARVGRFQHLEHFGVEPRARRARPPERCSDDESTRACCAGGSVSTFDDVAVAARPSLAGRIDDVFSFDAVVTELAPVLDETLAGIPADP